MEDEKKHNVVNLPITKEEILIENGEDDLEFTYTLYNIAKNLEYELFKKGDIVFRIGDPGDKFYIILQGSVSILKLFETELFCTGEEYIELLSKLKSDNEKYMVKRTIILNKDKINSDLIAPKPEIYCSHNWNVGRARGMFVGTQF